MNNVNFLAMLTAEPQMRYEKDGELAVTVAYTMAPGRDGPLPITIKAFGKTAEAVKQGKVGQSIMGGGSIRQYGQEQNYAFEVVANSAIVVTASAEGQSGPEAIYSYNCTLVGNLGKDPELKYFESGRCKASGSIALSRGKDAPPDWIKWEAWGKTAELVNQYCSRGSKIGIQGKLKIDLWGKDKSPVMVANADRIEFLDSKRDRQEQQATTVSPIYQQPVAASTEYNEIPF